MKKFLALLAFSSLLFVSCLSDDAQPPVFNVPMPPTVNYTSGDADFSKFVSVGNSLTAGYSDRALFTDGQAASYPNLMASSFEQVGGGEFTMPLMADNFGGATLGGQPIIGNRLFLSFANIDPDDCTSNRPSPIPVSGTGTTEISSVLTGPFNNMGVPGAKSFHLLAPGYGNVAGVATGASNPYFVRFASSPNATVLGDAAAQAPTFFSLWIGNNDVLSFATSGGAGVDQKLNPDPSTYGGNDITSPLAFAQVYNGILQTLTAGGAKGVVANIADVTSIPYFTTVPFDPLDVCNPDFKAQVPTLNATFAGLNQVFAALDFPERSIVFSETATSPIIIKDEDLVDISAQITATLIAVGTDPGQAAVFGFLYGQARPAAANDLIVLTASSEIGVLNEEAFATLQSLGLPAASAGQLAINGITYPMEDKWVLTPEEQTLVAEATTAFNQTIAAAAVTFDLAFVDANAYQNELKTTGIPLDDGTTVTAAFGTGGGFSLDGVHPSPRGYALIANKFMEEIGNKYGSVLPEVEPEAFTGVYIE